jgi:polyisoprenoid-binding protein YceI
VSSFKCITADCTQKGSFVVFEKNDSDIISFYNALFSVKVRSLDCNNSLINRDLYKTLNSDKYPFIVLQIKEAELISFFPNSVFKYKVKVDMTLANNQRETKGEVLVQKIDSGVFRVSGVQKIKLTDFNIKPPTAMLGLIVVDDEMTITFNLVLKARKDLIGN